MQTQQTTEKPNPVEQAEGSFTFSSSQELKALLNFINAIVSDEVTFHLSNEALTLRNMDPTRVSLTDLKLPRESFEEFHCAAEGDFSINVDKTLKRVFKHVHTRETVEITVTPSQATFLLKERLNRKFTQPLMENLETDDTPQNPKIRMTARAKLVASAFRQITEDLTEKCIISISDFAIKFADSPDTFGMDFGVTLEKDSDSLLDIEILIGANELPVTSKYSISHLAEYAKNVCKLSEIITLEIAKDMPIKFRCELAQGGSLNYWLAPRIEADD